MNRSFYSSLVLLWGVCMWFIHVNGGTPTVKSPTTISYQTLNNYRINFENAGKNTAFAYSYHIDFATVKSMIAAGAYSIRISNGLREGIRVFILTPVDNNYTRKSGQDYLIGENSLCPVLCDVALGETAEEISRIESENYISAYRNMASNERDAINSFVITKTVLNEFKKQSAIVNIRAYHLQNGNTRMIGLTGTNAEGHDITNLVYMQDASSLCPVLCD